MHFPEGRGMEGLGIKLPWLTLIFGMIFLKNFYHLFFDTCLGRHISFLPPSVSLAPSFPVH